MNTTMRKRYSSVMFILALAATLLAACSGGNGGNGGNGTTTDPANTPNDTGSTTPAVTTPATPEKPAPSKISIITEYSTGWPPKPDWAVWKWLQEETNITVEQQTFASPESLALAVASGEMPDIMHVYPGEVAKFGPQGAFLDLSQHMDKMPNVKAFLDSNPEFLTRVTQPDGKIYNLINSGGGAGNQLVWFYREDIFQKHDLKPPTTWDELYTVSKKLKELYPDSYPFVFRHGIGTLNTFGPSFGIYPEYFRDPSTGKFRYGANDPSFKTMVTQLNKLYSDGLFPPDWLSMDYKSWTQFMTTNKSFISVQYVGQIEIINNQLTEGKLKFMAPPLGAGDKAYLPKATEDFGFAVSSNTKNLDAVLRFLDYMYSPKGKEVQSWGREGETYTIENGKKKFLPIFKEANDLRREVGIGTHGAYGLLDFDAWIALVKEDEKEPYIESQKYSYPLAPSLPNLTKEESATIVTQTDQLFKHYSTSVSKFIMGETPLAEWDAFVSSLNQYGLPQILETYQTADDRVKK
ncbi:extracellular solute-binding protein [Paenibacillus methanolicus]|uniref:Putative aldouronate transport system substrate-binding protein n=1 Tax=Paenibacillus methanolicus TaxID=582686 RepID=A0A5S5CKS3_9BACL|nr:extracellular solute-binding protein [Paenibacillus methanolicus]TYP79325.1 putative aldouronate transport system substrate-binding protein [Paenibacillus methanolicus]